jgi:hypothetical protein
VIKESRLKDTTLDDSAEIYQHREQLSEKQKLKEMTFREKLTYFNNYYKVTAIVVLVIIGFVIYMGYSILTPSPETVLYTAVINNALDDPIAETLQSEIGKQLNINEKTQNIIIDTSFILGSDANPSEYAMANQQKLATYFYASEVDVIIAPESVFKAYAKNGSFSKLSDELPADMCNTLADSFYYSTTSEDPNSSVYGVYLNNSAIYDNKGNIIDKPVLGIVVNSDYKQNAVEFIRYLFKL